MASRAESRPLGEQLVAADLAVAAFGMVQNECAVHANDQA
jgi:hypothetical protein